MRTYNYIIVIARYMETLEWINDDIFKNSKLIIYNKGLDNNFTKNDNILKIINLPNVGREGHTYLYHIISNYKKNKPYITIFLPGSLDNQIKYLNAKFILEQVIKNNYTKSVFIGQILSKTKLNKVLNLSIGKTYISTNINNANANINSDTLPTITPFKSWLIAMKLKCINFVIFNGTFAVHRDIINSNSLNYYKKLISELEPSIFNKQNIIKYSNPVSGHYFERCWPTIFFSDKSIYFDYKINKDVNKLIIRNNCNYIISKIKDNYYDTHLKDI